MNQTFSPPQPAYQTGWECGHCGAVITSVEESTLFVSGLPHWDGEKWAIGPDSDGWVVLHKVCLTDYAVDLVGKPDDDHSDDECPTCGKDLVCVYCDARIGGGFG